ncbi:MAG: hypothetical protein LBC12_04900 [Nitrososphaerota archaeon]|jgi:hypothetical protein|nr:hypothetical protein [Nitrososphaerota archaeon]
MNWKNVYYLLQVERKSGRLLRGVNPTKYAENRILANWPYLLSIVIGVVIGGVAWFLTGDLSDAMGAGEFQNYAARIFVILPTMVLIINAIMSMLYQLQRSGVKMQAEAPYWLPITWQEHTLASVLASVLGLPLDVVLFISSVILVFSIFNGLLILAIATSIAMFAAAFLTSTLTEILRILQVRSMGAVHKSSGKSAIWVRFISSLGFFVIFYVIYMLFIQRGADIFLALTGIQGSLFYIPFIWPGLALSNFFISGSILLGTVFLLLSIAFISALYALTVLLNKRFGLYEPPAIKLQSGTYTPKTGILGKLGFTTTEAAIISKDLKAFTRRRELIPVFITPVVFTILPFMQSFGATNAELPFFENLFFFGMIFIIPASFMVYMLGSFIIGEEGQAIWRIYASPISAKNLVKSKYFFTVLFGLIILAITGTIGTIVYKPAPTTIVIAFLEGLFLIVALGAISVNIGFRGADFVETPKPRMIRQSWMLISLVSCFLTALVILAPLVLYIVLPIISLLLGIPEASLSLNPLIATAISGIIATVIAILFYKFTLNTAKDFLRKAEV